MAKEMVSHAYGSGVQAPAVELLQPGELPWWLTGGVHKCQFDLLESAQLIDLLARLE